VEGMVSHDCTSKHQSWLNGPWECAALGNVVRSVRGLITSQHFFWASFCTVGSDEKKLELFFGNLEKMLNYKNGKILKPENYYLRNEVKSGPRSQPMFSGQFLFSFLF